MLTMRYASLVAPDCCCSIGCGASHPRAGWRQPQSGRLLLSKIAIQIAIRCFGSLYQETPPSFHQKVREHFPLLFLQAETIAVLVLAIGLLTNRLADRVAELPHGFTRQLVLHRALQLRQLSRGGAGKVLELFESKFHEGRRELLPESRLDTVEPDADGHPCRTVRLAIVLAAELLLPLPLLLLLPLLPLLLLPRALLLLLLLTAAAMPIAVGDFLQWQRSRNRGVIGRLGLHCCLRCRQTRSADLRRQKDDASWTAAPLTDRPNCDCS